MSALVIEGTWEEIERHKAEFSGHQLRLTIKPQHSATLKPKSPQNTATGVTPPRISAMGKYPGILSSEEFMRQKHEGYDPEDRAR